MSLSSDIEKAFEKNLGKENLDNQDANGRAKIKTLSDDLANAFANWVKSQVFTITEAEATIQIPPVTSQVSAPVVGGTAAGGGPLLPGSIATGTAISPTIISKAVIKKASEGTPSNQSPEADPKSQSSKVQLLNANNII
jgi:hypothetical protein|tara:strand:+ start:85 stop:501 length:417 start_codon:yes stop_codon:yes gene_type:complete